GHRPAGPGEHLGHRARPGRRRHGGRLHHPLPGGGRTALRPHRHRRPRADPGRGDARRAQGQARRGGGGDPKRAFRSRRGADRSRRAPRRAGDLRPGRPGRLHRRGEGSGRAPRRHLSPGGPRACDRPGRHRAAEPERPLPPADRAGAARLMRLLLAMVEKDLLRRLRSPLPTILLLLFPLIFAGLIALTFRGAEARVPKARLLLDDQDGGLVGRLVGAAFSREEAQTYFEVKTLTAEERKAGDTALLEREEATALLRLPAGFTDDVLAG